MTVLMECDLTFIKVVITWLQFYSFTSLSTGKKVGVPSNFLYRVGIT